MYPELDRAVRFLSNVADSYSTVLLAVDQGRLRVVSHHSLGNISSRRSVPVAESGIYAVVLKNQKPISIDNYDRNSTEFFFYDEDVGIKSVALFPIGNRGVLHVDSKRSYIFTDRALKIIHEFVEIIEDLMDGIASKLERKGLSFTLRLLEKGIPLAVEGDIKGLMELFTREAKADVAFFAVERNGEVFLEEFVPEGAKEPRPLPKDSVICKAVASGRPFYSEMPRGFDEPVFWEFSEIREKVRAILMVPCAGGYIGFCRLKSNRSGNIKLLMHPLEVLVPIMGRRKRSGEMDPVTGFLDPKSFRELSGDGHTIEVKLMNIVDIYEELGPEGGDEFLKRFSQVLKKVVTSRIKFRAVFGRLGPHHFRVFIPGDLGDIRELLKLLKMAFGNLAVCVGSKRIKPKIEMRHI